MPSENLPQVILFTYRLTTVLPAFICAATPPPTHIQIQYDISLKFFKVKLKLKI
jgi:hypothetical protein